MAKYSNTQAPITNPKASQRIADTQAIRARSLIGAAPVATPPQALDTQAAQLTAQAGQQALQAQATQAGQAQQQVGQQMGQQRLAQAKTVGAQEQNLVETQRRLDDKLFRLNENAANEEQKMRIDFTNNQAYIEHLEQQQLADWSLANSKSEDEFKDRLLMIDQAHTRRADMINHSYQVIMKDLKQKSRAATQDRKQEFKTQIADINKAWKKEQQKQKAEAANREAMSSAFNTVVAGVASVALTPALGPTAPKAGGVIKAGLDVVN
jgi:hypothetical protein